MVPPLFFEKILGTRRTSNEWRPKKHYIANFYLFLPENEYFFLSFKNSQFLAVSYNVFTPDFDRVLSGDPFFSIKNQPPRVSLSKNFLVLLYQEVPPFNTFLDILFVDLNVVGFVGAVDFGYVVVNFSEVELVVFSVLFYFV